MIAPLSLIRVADTETTGMEDPIELVEIGWTDLRLYPAGWEIEAGPLAELVNPGMPITFGAMAAHHISQAEAETGMHPDRARALIQSGADIIATHNWQYDRRLIPTTKPVICTYKCAKTVWPNLESYSNGAIRYQRGLCIGDPRAYPPHRGGPDTWVTAHILLDLLKERTAEELVEISATPLLLLKIDFGKHAGAAFTDLPDDYLSWVLRSDIAKDPSKEDLVHTVKHELRRRGGLVEPGMHTPHEDPDAWRSRVEKF